MHYNHSVSSSKKTQNKTNPLSREIILEIVCLRDYLDDTSTTTLIFIYKSNNLILLRQFYCRPGKLFRRNRRLHMIFGCSQNSLSSRSSSLSPALVEKFPYSSFTLILHMPGRKDNWCRVRGRGGGIRKFIRRACFGNKDLGIPRIKRSFDGGTGTFQNIYLASQRTQ